MEQVKELFRSTGWILHIRKRRKGTQYAYAARRVGKKMEEVYFAPWLRVEQMSKEQVLEKLVSLKK